MNDVREESVQVFDRDAEGNVTQAKKIAATRSELSGYRICGIFTALEAVRDQLVKSGVTVRMAKQMTEKHS